jgi:Tfp pilus assembly protein PilN
MSATAIIRLRKGDFSIFVLERSFRKKSLRGVSDRKVMEGEELSGLLREELARLRESEGIREALVVIPLSFVIPGFCRLPLMKREDLLKAVPFELESHLPLPPEEYVFSVGIMRSWDAEAEVLALALGADRFREIKAVFDETEIRLMGIRVWFVELLNEAIGSGMLKEEDFILIAKEEDSFGVAAFRDGVLISLRDVKKVQSLPLLIQRLKGHQEMPVYLSSGLESLLSGTEVPLSIDESHVLQRILEEGRFDFDFVGVKKDFLERRYPVLAGGLALVSTVLYLSSIFVPYILENNELRLLKAEIVETGKKAAGLIEKNRQREELRKKVEEMTALRKWRLLPVKILREVTERLPEDSWIISFRYDGKGLEISGFSPRATEVIEPLEASPLFRNVRFGSPVIARSGKERFVLKMEVVR